VQLEQDIERAFTTWANRLPNVRCRKLKDDSGNGFPDRTVFIPRGKTLYIEFKTPRGKVSPNQQRWADWLNENGFPALITNDLNTAKEFVESYL
jgi:hypothetical protein